MLALPSMSTTLRSFSQTTQILLLWNRLLTGSLRKRVDFPGEDLVIFKSDISDAYRNLPMHVHPLWQIEQINTIKGFRHVDRWNCFGGKGSGSLFIRFNALVKWIAKYERQIRDLGAYSDDSFGVDLANLSFYEPYGHYYHQRSSSWPPWVLCHYSIYTLNNNQIGIM